ncbi:hypothetical protein HAX54_025658, partial [Datura stramonium]|nr:hypothetical protein [Datura stramonium]
TTKEPAPQEDGSSTIAPAIASVCSSRTTTTPKTVLLTWENFVSMTAQKDKEEWQKGKLIDEFPVFVAKSIE